MTNTKIYTYNIAPVLFRFLFIHHLIQAQGDGLGGDGGDVLECLNRFEIWVGDHWFGCVGRAHQVIKQRGQFCASLRIDCAIVIFLNKVYLCGQIRHFGCAAECLYIFIKAIPNGHIIIKTLQYVLVVLRVFAPIQIPQ